MCHLDKIFELIQKTGDRCVVLPPDRQEPFVVMSLAEYERLALRKNEVTSLTEDELLDKINRDIAIWKSQQEVADDRQDYYFRPKPEGRNWGPWGSNPEEDFDDEDEDKAEDPYYFESIDR